jgi:alpha-beta hydrolase superfamily lysophospholipase
MNEGTLRVNDGLSVFLATWEPRGEARGAVGIVHGLGEHAGLYAEVGGFLADRGWTVLAIDLPGHGRNPGVRGHGSYALYEETIGALAAEARRRAGHGSPVFLYGHSMGSTCIISWQLANPGEHLAGIVISSPSLGAPDPKPPAAKKALAKVLARLAPSVMMENGLDLENLSRDPARTASIRRDPLFHTKVSALLGVSFLDAWDRFARWPGGPVASPVLVQQGTEDRCVDPQASISVAKRMQGDVTLKVWDGHRHVLHEEPDRAEVLAYVAAWMEARAR